MTAEKVKSGLSLANKITLGRILGIPVFVLLMIYYILGLQRGEPDEYLRWSALVMFVVVALTDALDGAVARSRNEITHLGRILDPLADKALLLSSLILLTRPSIPGLQPHIPIGFTLLVISRDVLLFLGAVIVHAIGGHVEIRPRIVGKLATFFQMLAIVWVLAAWPSKYFVAAVGPAFLFTLISALWYLLDGVQQLEKAAQHHAQHQASHV